MKESIYIAIGGAVGAVARYWVSRLFAAIFSGTLFPLATLIINVVGSFFLGLLFSYLLSHHVTEKAWQLFLTTGLLGGFTTFSAFSVETIRLFLAGHKLLAIGYILLSVSLSLFFAFIGMQWVMK